MTSRKNWPLLSLFIAQTDTKSKSNIEKSEIHLPQHTIFVFRNLIQQRENTTHKFFIWFEIESRWNRKTQFLFWRDDLKMCKGTFKWPNFRGNLIFGSPKLDAIYDVFKQLQLCWLLDDDDVYIIFFFWKKLTRICYYINYDSKKCLYANHLKNIFLFLFL